MQWELELSQFDRHTGTGANIIKTLPMLSDVWGGVNQLNARTWNCK